MSEREVSVKMEFDESQVLEKAQRYLMDIPGGAKKAVMRAINRAIEGGATTASREVTKVYTVKAKDVRKTISLQKANEEDLTASLTSRGRPLSLASFAHKPQNDTTGSKRKPVTVAVRRGTFKPIDRGFIWKGHIFKRVGKARLPVQFLYAPSIPVMLSQDNISSAVKERISADFEKRLEHETGRLLGGNK